ncbi:SIMPL domain-containing protein [Noviherbaspirillum aerium]|uniref:SIMPL domain-containing protein n=1 Tax=Noviherbaspirillum aerium TaxID=2588497 RepID=UPI00124DB858
MRRVLTGVLLTSIAIHALPVHAQAAMPAASAAPAAAQTSGTLVIVPAFGEVRHANDEARVSFMIEEQDKDKSAAASRVNLKMKQGMEILRKEDARAELKTGGYYTYPVYADEGQPRPLTKPRQAIGWRVGQYLEVTTSSLAELPRTVAAAQKVLALSGLQFTLSPATNRKLEEERIAAAYANLTDRIAAVAKAMGRNVSDAVLDTVDFEASGAFAERSDMRMAKPMSVGAAAPAAVEEPSFEPGETVLNSRVVGKVRFK